MDSNFWSRNSRIRVTAMDSDYNIRRGQSSPECYPEKFSRSRLNDASSFEKRTTSSGSRKRQFEDDEALQYYSRKSMYYSRDCEFCSSPWIINMKQDTTYPSFEDLSVNNMAICNKRIKSSEVHKNSLNSQSHQTVLENTKLKNNKSCKKHSKEETSYVNTSEKNSKNATCYSKPLTQLQKMDNDLKVFCANKSVKNIMKLKSAPESNSIKNSMKLKSAPESNSIKNSMKLKSVRKSKSAENSMELKSAQEICTESVKRKKFKNEQKSKNTKLCCDVDDDTLILCIDEDEASDILFGDLKSKVLKSFKEHEKEKCKQDNT